MTDNPNKTPRRLGAALAGAAVGMAGLTGTLLLLGQTAGAEVQAAPTEAVADETLEQSGEAIELDQDAWAAFDGCLVEHGVLTAEEVEQMYSEAFEDFDEDGDYEDGYYDDGDEAWVELPGVAVSNGEHMTFVDFGEGNGSVTIEKVGDEVRVTSTGDVVEETISFDDLEAEFEGELDEFGEFDGEFDGEFEAEMEAWDTAIDSCENLAPEGTLDYEDFDDEGIYEDAEDAEDAEDDANTADDGSDS